VLTRLNRPGSTASMAWKFDDRLMPMICSHLRIGELVDRCHELHAGVVDQDVDTAEGGFGLRDHLRDLGRLAHVGGAVGELHGALGGQLAAQRLDPHRARRSG
jgi:hypothetical protein